MGGRWYERGVDGSECTWGRVVSWDPPERVLLTWQLTPADFTYDPDFEMESPQIRFTPEGPNATRVDLEHRHSERYGEKAGMIRPTLDAPEGWTSTWSVSPRLPKRHHSGRLTRSARGGGQEPIHGLGGCNYD